MRGGKEGNCGESSSECREKGKRCVASLNRSNSMTPGIRLLRVLFRRPAFLTFKRDVVICIRVCESCVIGYIYAVGRESTKWWISLCSNDKNREHYRNFHNMY